MLALRRVARGGGAHSHGVGVIVAPHLRAAALATPTEGSFSQLQWQSVRWATKKTGGSTKNSKDSAGRRLGVKAFGGETVKPGSILIRQRGTKYHPVWEGDTVGLGRDHTIYAKRDGVVKFLWNPKRRRTFVAVLPADETATWLDQFSQSTKARSPSWNTF